MYLNPLTILWLKQCVLKGTPYFTSLKTFTKNHFLKLTSPANCWPFEWKKLFPAFRFTHGSLAPAPSVIPDPWQLSCCQSQWAFWSFQLIPAAPELLPAGSLNCCLPWSACTCLSALPLLPWPPCLCQPLRMCLKPSSYTVFSGESIHVYDFNFYLYATDCKIYIRSSAPSLICLRPM